MIRAQQRRMPKMALLFLCLAPAAALVAPSSLFGSRRRTVVSDTPYNFGGSSGYTGPDRTPLLDSVIEPRDMKKFSIAELKQLVQRPDVVEAHDVTASDPRLLVYLKAYRNSVPVPRHWCHKRKYLQGKRGVEKKPWQLPEFIAQTGPAPRPSRLFFTRGNGDDSENIQTVIPV